MCKCILCTSEYAGKLEDCPVCKDWGHYADRLSIMDELRVQQWVFSVKLESFGRLLSDLLWMFKNEPELIRRENEHRITALKREFQEVRQMAINAGVPKSAPKNVVKGGWNADEA